MDKRLKGSLLIALGASSYGMLATFVKIAYKEGFTIGEVTIAQFALGFAGLSVLTLLSRRSARAPVSVSGEKSIWKLIVAGLAMGLTGTSYYMAVKYVPVSVGIVLLMQAVWMGVVLEMVLHRKAPGVRKIVATVIILGGTALATQLLGQSVDVNWKGFAWGIVAAMAYTTSMYAANHIALGFPPLKRSLYMILGGLITVVVIFHSSLTHDFSHTIIFRWGWLLALFGTILPPLLFNRGMPLTGVGLGAIVASVEIPVSIAMAQLLLGESVTFVQWVGVVLILFAVAFMNMGK